MLSPDYCRERQKRLLGRMESEGLALVLLANPKTIYYFSGALVDPALPQAFALDGAGHSLLVTNQEPQQAAAEKVELYTGYTIERPFNRTSQMAEAVAALRQKAGAGTVGLEQEFVTCAMGQVFGGKTVNITPALIEMRRIKDPDEIESIRDTIRLTQAGYKAIERRLAPGMTEFEAYTIFHEALVAHAQTSVDLRGDFACGTRAIRGGGPPTARRLQEGDLYILDIFPFYHGYHCDLTRTFAIGTPSPLQREAWEVIRQAHERAEKLIRPGVTGRQVYQEIKAWLDSFPPCTGSFWHHLGHGLGMDGWEFPWLTPGSDLVIQQGEVLAVEPGLYGECLQGGIRIEHDYLVGADGIEALDHYPIEL